MKGALRPPGDVPRSPPHTWQPAVARDRELVESSLPAPPARGHQRINIAEESPRGPHGRHPKKHHIAFGKLTSC